jgi:hypothetical protein
MELFEELRAADAGDLGGFALRDQPLREPVDRRRQAHLRGELLWGLAESREDRRGEVENDLSHVANPPR